LNKNISGTSFKNDNPSKAIELNRKRCVINGIEYPSIKDAAF
jgi:hypothetical protein